MVISGACVKSAAGNRCQKATPRRRNDGDGRMAIAGAGEIMEWNERAGTGARTRVLNRLSTGAPYLPRPGKL